MTGGMPGLTWYLVEISCSADRHDSGNVRVVQYLLVFDRRSLSDGSLFSQSSYQETAACWHLKWMFLKLKYPLNLINSTIASFTKSALCLVDIFTANFEEFGVTLQQLRI